MVINIEEEAFLEQRWEARMKLIKEMADLECERDKETDKLKRKARQTLLRFNFRVLEEMYGQVRNLSLSLISRMDN